MLVVVAYDIFMDEKGPKVLGGVFKVCKRYLFKMQHSVFIGELNNGDFDALKGELKNIVRSVDKCDILIIKNIKNLEHFNLNNNYDKFNII